MAFHKLAGSFFLVIFLLKFLCLPAMSIFFVRECRGAELMFDFLKRCAVSGALKGHLLHTTLKRKLNTVPPTFSIFYSGAGWSRATLHRQVEMCAFHHNLSLLSLLLYCLRKCGFYFVLLLLYQQWGGIKTKNADNVRVFGGGGGGSEIPENADILGVFFPRKFFSSPGLYTILTKIYKNSSISAN